MIQTDKYTCRQLAQALAAFGIRNVVVSPGSRNAPLIMAVNRHPQLMPHVVIDERSAAFIALGMAEISALPVAMICTSGSAILNYGPAIAEAYYKKLPLIAISADRPLEWIDQADSQTIRQPQILSNVVKRSFSLKAEATSSSECRYIDRMLNEALICATTPPFGPVHINIAVSEPIAGEAELPQAPFIRVKNNAPALQLNTMEARTLAEHLEDRNVLVVAGVHTPSATLNKALTTLASMPNVVVLAEELANVKGSGIIGNPDILPEFADDAQNGLPQPDLLISYGGALVSATLKRRLRALNVHEHWHVGVEPNLVDTFCHLTDSFNYMPELFFLRLANAVAYRQKRRENSSDFAERWKEASKHASALVATRIQAMKDGNQWNSIVAVHELLNQVPRQWNIQLSNGMTVRYAQLFRLQRLHRVDSNRGVSGIDGSTSTAIGASLAYIASCTLLITGDMSFIYDIGALTSPLVTPRLKIVVINNGGGGIFKLIGTTSKLPETPEYLHCGLNLPIEKIAATFGFNYFRADTLSSLSSTISHITAPTSGPCILEIIADADTDALTYKNLLK